MAEDLQVSTEVGEDLEDKFDDLIQGLPSEDGTPASEDETPPSPDESQEDTVVDDKVADLPKAEGTTTAMESFASEKGIPPQLIALARDDEQLREMVNLADDSKGQAPPAPEMPKFEISLPEDEYGEDNAVRDQFVKLRDHYEGILDEFRGDMSSIVGAVRGMHDDQKETVKRGEASEQQKYDDACDSLNSETFGAAGRDIGELQQGVRALAYGPYQEILRANPSMSHADALAAAVQKALPELSDNNKAKQQRQSLQAQSRQRLGSGQSKPAPESGPGREERFDNFLAKLGK